MSEKTKIRSGSAQSKSRVDRWLDIAKDHKILSIVIFSAMILTGVATVSDSLRRIIEPIFPAVENSKEILMRLDAETFLQANRGDIERCLRLMPQKYFYLDFVFTRGPDSTIDVDVLHGAEAGGDLEFLHPALRKQDVEGYKGHEALRMRSAYGDRKLSVIAPDANGCIMRALGDEVKKFKINHWEQGFVHRYIIGQIPW